MKGSQTASEMRVFRDEEGVELTQLTGHESINHATYFLQSSLTPDGGCLIFTT
jgi:hypothetical protein